MVDLQGKYYTFEELDNNFIAACVDKDAYGKHAGDYVKNAYDPRFNPDGVWDKKTSEKSEDLNIVMCMEMKMAGEASTFRNIHTTIRTAGVPISQFFTIRLTAGSSKIRTQKHVWWNLIRPSTGSQSLQVQADLATGWRILTTGT